MARKITKAALCDDLARDMRRSGSRGVTSEIVRDVLAAWLAGAGEFPHGGDGMAVSRRLEQIEMDSPGLLSSISSGGGA